MLLSAVQTISLPFGGALGSGWVCVIAVGAIMPCRTAACAALKFDEVALPLPDAALAGVLVALPPEDGFPLEPHAAPSNTTAVAIPASARWRLLVIGKPLTFDCPHRMYVSAPQRG